MSIKCLKYRAINKGMLLGMADFLCEKAGFELYGCGVYQKEGRLWIGMPQRDYIDKESGEKKYVSTVRIPNQEHYQAFQKLAQRALDEWIKENSQPEPQQQFMTEAFGEEMPF